MQIILWRHGEAEAKETDSDRSLTEKGRQQAQKTARFIDNYFPKKREIWISPLKRSQETASYLNFKGVILEKDFLIPSYPLSAIKTHLYQQKPDTNLIVVGHQPWLGELVSHLVLREPEKHSPHFSELGPFKKGALWWLVIDHRNEYKAYIKAVLPPDLLN